MSGLDYELLRSVYDEYLRERTPRVLGVYNGVLTRKYHVLDFSKSYREPMYKRELVNAVKSNTNGGDTVVEIGSGFGVCTVWAARLIGDRGRVVAYEASRKQVDVVKEALELNGDIVGEDLTARVQIRQALVGPKNKTYGSIEGSQIVNPSDLEPGDMLVMDCEGAEREILRGLDTLPETIVVETHPDFDAPSDLIETILENYGYDLTFAHLSEMPEGSKDIVTARSSAQ